MANDVVDLGDPAALYRARRVLHAGNVAVLPTESLYGFSAVADSETARRRIIELKEIRRARPFVGLVPKPETVDYYVDTAKHGRALEFLRTVWPAPLTAVLPLRRALPWGEPLDSGGTAAFRVPAHPRLLELLRDLGQVLLSTSVNRSGQEPLPGIAAIGKAFGHEPDVWLFRDSRLERRARESTSRRASTVADFGVWPPRLLRAGSFDLDAALTRTGVT